MQLVGRSHEREILLTLLQRVGQSQGQVAFITGDAGIGKTRLLASLIGMAETGGFAVIRGECVEQDQDFPYAPIIDGLRTHFSGIDSDELHRVIDPFQPEIIKLLPELAHRIGETRTSTPLEPEAEKRRLFEILVQVYQHAARAGLLLVFEDVHWCDANSLAFFQTLTRRISDLRIMVVLSSRLTAPDDEVSTLRLYLERAGNAQLISLSPLSEEEIEDLAKSTLQTSDAIHPSLLERLNVLGQGNPLYTEQIMHMLLQNRQINLVNGTWMVTSSAKAVEIPTSIKRVVLRQMEGQPENAQKMLRLAAVAGRQFELNVLQNLTGFDDAALTAAVKELIHQRLFEEVSRDRFAFRHALLRQAIYDDLLIRERQDLHLALLHIIEESDSMQSDAHLAELSHHAYQAEAWEAALHYGFRAGQRALSLHSPRAAAEHFTHAVEAASKLGDQASWELYMQRGKAYDSLGEFQQALDDYELALQASGDQTATWQTLIAIALLWSARDYHQAEAYCKRAMDLAQSMQEPKLIGHSLNRLGNWFLNTGQPHEALDYHEQALAVFEELNDLQGKGETLDLLGMTNSQVLRLEASQNYYRDAMTIFRELDDKKMLASSMTNLAANTLDQPLAEEAVDIAHQIGWYSGEAYACIMLGYMISFQGHFSKSLSYLNRGLELAQAIDHIQWLAGAYVFSAFVYRDMLDLTTAAARAEQGSALAAEVGSQWYSDMGNGLLALILIEQGQLEAAEKILAQETVPDSPAMQHMMLAMAEIELTLANGHAELALSQLERIDRIFFSTSASDSSRAMWLVPYLMMRTRTLILLGRPADAADTLSQARHICEDMELLPFLWQVEIMIGQLAEDKAVAEQSFRRARDIINLLADRTPAGLRERFRRKAEKRIASDRGFAAASRSRHDLTAREMDIAREVALGKTNQQIADDLHITIKTVEAHITRALSKLDLTSRTQIALWAVENKIIPPSNVG